MSDHADTVTVTDYGRPVGGAAGLQCLQCLFGSGTGSKPMTTVRVLHSDELADLATPAEYVAAVRSGYRQRGEGAPAAPRTLLENADPPGVLTGYLAVLPETGAMGGYTYAAGFGDRDAHFMLPLFDVETGAPIALLDGAGLNPYKTGAAGAVGTDALARPDATELAIVGSGTQARGQLLATATVRDLDRVVVYSPTPEHRRAFAAEMGEQIEVQIEPVETAAAAVEGADIVVTATTATEPVFEGEALAPGTHVTAVGQYHPDRHELDAETIARAKYVPDLHDRVDQDAGSYIAARDGGCDPRRSRPRRAGCDHRRRGAGANRGRDHRLRQRRHRDRDRRCRNAPLREGRRGRPGRDRRVRAGERGDARTVVESPSAR